MIKSHKVGRLLTPFEPQILEMVHYREEDLGGVGFPWYKYIIQFPSTRPEAEYLETVLCMYEYQVKSTPARSDER